MGRHSYDYDPQTDVDQGDAPRAVPAEPPPLAPAPHDDGTGAESGQWQSAGEPAI